MKKLLVSLFSLLLLCSAAAMAAPPAIVDLQVEYTTTPLGIDAGRPRFSWKMLARDGARGQRQTAYALVVKDRRGAVVWESGKVATGQSLNIEYGGKPLDAAQRYDWSVQVWDQDGRARRAASWFETGLPVSDARLAGWSGAKWIGGGDQELPLYASYLPVFKLNYRMRLDQASGSTRAGFIFGANDPRLMDKFKNLHQLENARNASWIMLEIDTAPLRSKSDAVLNIYRSGYHPQDRNDAPFKSFAIPQSVINEGNQYQAHHVSVSANLGATRSGAPPRPTRRRWRPGPTNHGSTPSSRK